MAFRVSKRHFYGASALILSFVIAASRLLTVTATQVTIDAATNSNATSFFGTSPNVVFVSDQVGYSFFTNTAADLVYRKTTNGGTSWGAQTVLNNSQGFLKWAIWYDRWTPDDTTGTKVHIITTVAATDDMYYLTLDTSTDSVSSLTNISSVPGPALTNTMDRNNIISITKATDGKVFAGLHDAGTSSTSWVVACASSCNTASNWTDTGILLDAAVADALILVPHVSGTIMAIRLDSSLDDIQSKAFNGSTWAGSWTNIDTNAPDNLTEIGHMAAMTDVKNGNIYLAYASSVDTLGTNDDILVKMFNGSSWVSKTDVTTNDAKGITDVAIAMNESTADIYVGYLGRTTPATATTTSVYWKKSTDGMTTWGSEQGPVNTGESYMVGLSLNVSSNERVYATWQDNTLADVMGDTLVDLAPPTYEQSAYRFYLNTNSADVSSALAPLNSPPTLSAAGDVFRMRALIHVGGDGTRLNLDTFKLQYVDKGSGTCASPSSGTPSSYTDVTPSTLIAYNDNSTPTDGLAPTTNANDPTHSGHTIVKQSYEELNNFSISRTAVASGQDALWDFSLKDNGAASGTTYCLRIAKSDGTALSSYSQYPSITTYGTAGPTITDQLRGGQSVVNGVKTPFTW